MDRLLAFFISVFAVHAQHATFAANCKVVWLSSTPYRLHPLFHIDSLESLQMTFTLEEAIRNVYTSILDRDESAPLEQRTIIFGDATIEKSWGWIFFYNNERYYRTRDPSDAHVGGGPLFFNRETGDVRSFDSGCNLEDEIYDYEMELASLDRYWSLWITDSQERSSTILKVKHLLKLSTEHARDFVPTLPTPFFRGARRHLDWMASKCDALGIQTEIRLENEAPECLEFALPEHMIEPSAAQAFHCDSTV